MEAKRKPKNRDWAIAEKGKWKPFESWDEYSQKTETGLWKFFCWHSSDVAKGWDVLTEQTKNLAVTVGKIPIYCQSMLISTLYVGSHAVRSYIQSSMPPVKGEKATQSLMQTQTQTSALMPNQCTIHTKGWSGKKRQKEEFF